MKDGEYYWFVIIEYYDKMNEILGIRINNIDKLKKIYSKGMFIFMSKYNL